MEEKTAEGESSQSGCFFCTMLPLIERRWSEATRGHFKNSRVEFLKGMRSPDRRPYRASFARKKSPRGRALRWSDAQFPQQRRRLVELAQGLDDALRGHVHGARLLVAI